MVKKAKKTKVSPPYSIDKINSLIILLPHKDIKEFMANTETFFNIIYDNIEVCDSIDCLKKKE